MLDQLKIWINNRLESWDSHSIMVTDCAKAMNSGEPLAQGFLSLDTTDIWGQVILYCGCCSVHCNRLYSIWANQGCRVRSNKISRVISGSVHHFIFLSSIVSSLPCDWKACPHLHRAKSLIISRSLLKYHLIRGLFWLKISPHSPSSLWTALPYFTFSHSIIWWYFILFCVRFTVSLHQVAGEFCLLWSLL